MEERIRKAVSEALANMGASDISFAVERPSIAAHGDYATNAALAAAKILGRKPHEIADEIARFLIDALGKNIASHVAVAGPGFVNITLAREAVTLAVAEADAQGSEWGKGTVDTEQRVVIEYTDPNPFKEMHIGHLMSNIIGEALARLIGNEGSTVIRANYQGDVGPHVAKALWGLQKAGITEPVTAKEIGEAYAAGSHAYEESPETKVEIDALNQAIYAGTNHEIMELWRKGRDVSLAAFEQLYKILGTHFDYYFFESETAESGLRLVRDGLARGVFEESEGAVIYRGEKKGLHTLVFITSKGTPTYEAKDIGLAFLKEERVSNNRSIIVTAAEQIGHFAIVLAALDELAPPIAEKTTHVPHGFLRLASGKMSSRAGNVITAAGLIEDIIKKASEKNADPLIAEQVALGAIKYMILRQSPGSDIIFDEEKSLSLEGDSGPYLQYALVRAKSVLAAAAEKGGAPLPTGRQAQQGAPEAPYLLECTILHFPEVAARAARELAPNLLVNYLTELAGEWNSFYAQERIIGGDHEAHKLMLARAFVTTMTNGLTVLGIPTPERM
ncbi:MAG: arginine--tRNA ligase [Candidatus Kaiserbacteria bacterium]|nr:arginine--tRNA ligase [Candidatus Kaiserbacteria bacterium]